MWKKHFTWIVYLLIVILAIGTFILLKSVEPNIIEDRLLNLMNMLINSISISIGFFGAIFTFIFGLKENPVIEKIMNSKKTKSQFRYMNYGIVGSGFLIIFLILVLFVFGTMDVNSQTPSPFNNNIFYIILSIAFYFYCMFAIYLYTISNIFFQNQNNHMPIKKNPPIKKNR